MSTLGLKELLFITGLALANIIVPIGILRLAARRRPWTMRLVLALPVAAAVPLMVLLAVTPTFEARTNPWVAYARLEFLLATLAGVPFLVYTLAIGLALARGRWKSVAMLAALALVTSLVVAAVWIGYDMRSMPAIERYGSVGWYLVLVPGTFAAGVLVFCGWCVRGALQNARHPRLQPERNL